MSATEKRVVLITGASSGMGKEMAFTLVRQGHVVYGAARRVERMRDLVEAGGHALELDVTNEMQYAGGKIYDPPSGKTYGCKAWMKGDKLYLRGYLGLSLLGKTVSWHRYRTETAQEVALAVGDEATAVIKTLDDIVGKR